jgi:Holliday junction resolvase
MGKLSRTKGAAFERKVVNWFKSVLSWKAQRTAPMQAGHQDDYADVRAWSDRLVLEVECMHGKKPSIPRKIRQMEDQTRQGGLGVVITKADGEEPIVSMRLGTFGELMQAQGAG